MPLNIGQPIETKALQHLSVTVFFMTAALAILALKNERPHVYSALCGNKVNQSTELDYCILAAGMAEYMFFMVAFFSVAGTLYEIGVNPRTHCFPAAAKALPFVLLAEVIFWQVAVVTQFKETNVLPLDLAFCLYLPMRSLSAYLINECEATGIQFSPDYQRVTNMLESGKMLLVSAAVTIAGMWQLKAASTEGTALSATATCQSP